MAVLLHAYIDAREASVNVNVTVAKIFTVPLRISLTADGVVLATPGSVKLISPGENRYAYSITRALKGSVRAEYSKLNVSAYGHYKNLTAKFLNFMSSIINFALIYNTRLTVLGKKEFNLRFFEGEPNLVAEARVLIKSDFFGIISALAKILFAR